MNTFDRASSPAARSTTGALGSIRLQRLLESADDVARGLDPLDGVHTPPGLPDGSVGVLGPLASGQRRLLEIANRAQGIPGSNPFLGSPSREHPSGERPDRGADSLDVGGPDDGEWDPAQSLGQD